MAAVPRRRRRLEFFTESKWRLPCRERFTLPEAVTLNRFETALRVLLTTLFGMEFPSFRWKRAQRIGACTGRGKCFFGKNASWPAANLTLPANHFTLFEGHLRRRRIHGQPALVHFAGFHLAIRMVLGKWPVQLALHMGAFAENLAILII